MRIKILTETKVTSILRLTPIDKGECLPHDTCFIHYYTFCSGFGIFRAVFRILWKHVCVLMMARGDCFILGFIGWNAMYINNTDAAQHRALRFFFSLTGRKQNHIADFHSCISDWCLFGVGLFAQRKSTREKRTGTIIRYEDNADE